MSEEWEQANATAAAVCGSNRMAMGLPSIPSRIRGDMEAVADLHRQLVQAKAIIESARGLDHWIVQEAEKWCMGQTTKQLQAYINQSVTEGAGVKEDEIKEIET